MLAPLGRALFPLFPLFPRDSTIFRPTGPVFRAQKYKFILLRRPTATGNTQFSPAIRRPGTHPAHLRGPNPPPQIEMQLPCRECHPLPFRPAAMAAHRQQPPRCGEPPLTRPHTPSQQKRPPLVTSRQPLCPIRFSGFPESPRMHAAGLRRAGTPEKDARIVAKPKCGGGALSGRLPHGIPTLPGAIRSPPAAPYCS